MTLLVGIVFIVLAVVIYSVFAEFANSRRQAEVLGRVAQTVPAGQSSPATSLVAQVLELPDPQRQQAFGLLCLVHDAVTSGKYRSDQRTTYLLEQTLQAYLPDTLRAYLELTPGALERLNVSGQPAQALLTEQLSLMADGVQEALRRDHAAADRLLGQGQFLRERFGEAQVNPAGEDLKIR